MEKLWIYIEGNYILYPANAREIEIELRKANFRKAIEIVYQKCEKLRSIFNNVSFRKLRVELKNVVMSKEEKYAEYVIIYKGRKVNVKLVFTS